MIRRQARMRREFQYRKQVESRQKNLEDKKERLKRSLEDNTPIHTDLRRDAVQLEKKLKFSDDGPKTAAAGISGGTGTVNSQDDEYQYSGVEDPKVAITTSRDPSNKLKEFVKELRLIFPGAQRLTRGHIDIPALVHACRANEVTDLIVVNETRGVPDNLTVCHLPYGPTAYFNLSGVITRHDTGDRKKMSEQKPHLIFHNFKSTLGERTMRILKYLFPVPKEDSKRVMTFANHDDYICFRHHTYKKVDDELEMTEIGPRLTLRLYQIKLGTLENIEAADTEWVYRPYMNTVKKRRFLSDDDGWKQDDDVM